MNPNGTFNPSSPATSSSPAVPSSSFPPTPMTPDGYLNVTAGPLRSYIIDNPVNATCDGNVYSVVRTCCTQLRGITNSSSISCDAYCCTYSSGGLNGTCPVGKFKYPYCVLPTHLNYTDWDACYAPLVREIQDTMKEPPIATWGCTPPSAAGRCAVPVVLGFLVSVAVSVLSM